MVRTGSPPIGGQAKRHATKIHPKLLEATFSAVFSNFDKRWPEVADDVIFSVAVDYVVLDVRVKFNDCTWNSGWIIQLFLLPDPFYAFFCSI